jgi:hypothetical protein
LVWKIAMLDYWRELRDTLLGNPIKKDKQENLAMLWGSMNEESARVTYLKGFFSENHQGDTVKETGICFLNDSNGKNWLASSPGGLVEKECDRKRTAAIEIKCPFMGGKPVPYK